MPHSTPATDRPSIQLIDSSRSFTNQEEGGKRGCCLPFTEEEKEKEKEKENGEKKEREKEKKREKVNRLERDLKTCHRHAAFEAVRAQVCAALPSREKRKKGARRRRSESGEGERGGWGERE